MPMLPDPTRPPTTDGPSIDSAACAFVAAMAVSEERLEVLYDVALEAGAMGLVFMLADVRMIGAGFREALAVELESVGTSADG